MADTSNKPRSIQIFGIWQRGYSSIAGWSTTQSLRNSRDHGGGLLRLRGRYLKCRRGGRGGVPTFRWGDCITVPGNSLPRLPAGEVPCTAPLTPWT